MTRIEVGDTEVRLFYQKGEKESLIRMTNTFFPHSGPPVVVRPGGLWAYEALGMGDRYRRITRLRALRKLFGPKDYPSLDTYPFRVEVIREDREGRVGILQLGDVLWGLSTFSPEILRAPEGLAKRFSRNGHLVISQGSLRRLKGTTREIWERMAKEGVADILESLGFSSLGEDGGEEW